MNARIAVLSETGARESNEDACGYWQREGPICCVLSDGAGGHQGGYVASRIAVATVLNEFAALPTCSPEALRDLLERANRAVVAGQERDPTLQDMRATLVVLLLDPHAGCAIWGHIGDSRLYCLRDGRIVAQTKDHSLYQSMLDAGFVHDDQRRGNPERNVLTASLGSLEDFEPDVRGAPFATQSGDAFLMCSDGLWDCVEESRIEAALQDSSSPDDWLSRLAAEVAAVARATQDNYSAVALWLGEMDFRTQLIAASDSSALPVSS